MSLLSDQTILDYHAYLVRGDRDALGWLKQRFAEERRAWLVAGEKEPELVIRDQERWKIEDSREFRSLQVSRWQAGRRWLVIICNQMTIEAEQALLKTLEEPSFGVQIFIILPQPDKLLPTIQSRCRLIDRSQLVLEDFSAGRRFLTLGRGERLAEIDKIFSADDGRVQLEKLLADLEQFGASVEKSDVWSDLIGRLFLARGWLGRGHVLPKFVGQFLAVTLPRYSK